MTGFGREEGRRRNFAVSQAVRRGPGAAILSLPRESQGLSFFRQPYFAQYSTIKTMINFDACCDTPSIPKVVDLITQWLPYQLSQPK